MKVPMVSAVGIFLYMVEMLEDEMQDGRISDSGYFGMVLLMYFRTTEMA